MTDQDTRPIPTFYFETDEGGDPIPCYADEGYTIRLSNPDAENGYNEARGPLDWLNSARISLDPESDAVRCLVSVGDPRGAFCFTVRRLRNGSIRIDTPYPGESLPHMRTAQVAPGVLEIVSDYTPPGEMPKPVNFNRDE